MQRKKIGKTRRNRVLPDKDICRVKSIGLKKYAECLVDSPVECKYAISFGYTFFCKNPKRKEIIEGIYKDEQKNMKVDNTNSANSHYAFQQTGRKDNSVFKRNPRILIIDDDPDVRISIKAILQSKNYVVITASDGKQGLKKTRLEKPDLIILDIMLPDQDGFSICRELKENSETLQIPVLILTSLSKKRGESYVDLIAYSHKADGFIEKPVDKDELLFSIEKLLEKNRIEFPKLKKKRTILIVDNNSDFVSELEKVLKANSFEVFVAESGIEAQKIAQAFSPALILLEITLPDMDGYSVCFELKRNPKTLHIPVFIVSNINNKLSNSEYAVRIALEHQADRFIAKPIETEELLKIIMEIF